MKKIIFMLLTSYFLQACYPVYKTIRPALEIQVSDENGNRIDDVKVVRMTEQRPAHVPLRFDVAHTNDQGEVIFNQQRKWELEHLMIHGVQFYSWSICVSKAGYETKEMAVKSDSNKNISFKLKKTHSKKSSEECIDETMD